MLEKNARVLSAAEINSSFHRPHKRETYERWAASVPGDFAFCVKVPKAISHSARLENAAELLDAFIDQVAGLGSKLHVLLLQLPPSLPFDESVATAFFEQLIHRAGATIGIVCEPRVVSV